MILISVVVCTYKRPNLLKNILGLLEKQSVDNADFEIIVVDNNSQDDTERVVQRAIDLGNKKIRYVVEEKRGITHARNKGIREAKGELIAFTDDDCLIPDNWIIRLYTSIKETNAAMVGGRIKSLWKCDRPSWITEKKQDGVLINWDLGDERKEIKLSSNTPFPFTANLMFKAELVRKIGYFKSCVKGEGGGTFGSEDIEFCLRALKSGERIMYEPNATVQHPVHPERLNKSYFRKRYFCGGRALTKLHSGSAIYYFGVPRFMYRQIVEDSIKYLYWLLKGDRKKSFYYEGKAVLLSGFFFQKWFMDNKNI